MSKPLLPDYFRHMKFQTRPGLSARDALIRSVSLKGQIVAGIGPSVLTAKLYVPQRGVKVRLTQSVGPKMLPNLVSSSASLNFSAGSFLTGAKGYAEREMPVFPVHSVVRGECSCGNPGCDALGKHPRTKNGFKDATTDREQVHKWMNQWPNANVGMPTGPESGFFVLDIDGPSGQLSLQELLAKYGPLPGTWRVQTGDGIHLYFRYPEGIEIQSSTSKIGKNLDIRGCGGYVIVPPSLHYSGRKYEWIQSPADTQLADAPQWLIELATAAKEAPKESLDLVLDGVPEGQRDEKIFKFACSCAGKGYPKDLTIKLALEAAGKCEPPFSTRLALQKVESAYKTHAINHHDKKRPTKFQIMTDLVEKSKIAFFHDQFEKPWACISINGHHENNRIKSGSFQNYLTRLYYTNTKDGLGREVRQQIQDLYAAKALFESAQVPLSNRAAWQDGKILIDLGTSDWKAVEISPNGWQIIQPSRPPFRRHSHQEPLPIPQPGGRVDDILRILPITDKNSQDLLCVWLPSVLIPDIPRPGLVLHGVQGGGKTFTTERIRELVDPSTTLTLSLSKDATELVQILDHITTCRHLTT